MNLNNIIKITKRSQKRVGRGIGSGKGKTSGRGTKGQKARGKVAQGFIGGTLPLYKKLPYRRGMGNAKKRNKSIPLPVSVLEVFKAREVVNVASLIEKKIISEKKVRKGDIKLVGNGTIKVALEVKLPATKSATSAIEKAGGKVVSA